MAGMHRPITHIKTDIWNAKATFDRNVLQNPSLTRFDKQRAWKAFLRTMKPLTDELTAAIEWDIAQEEAHNERIYQMLLEKKYKRGKKGEAA